MREPRGDARRGCSQPGSVAWGTLEPQCAIGDLDLGEADIGGELQMGWALLTPAGLQYPVDLIDGIFRGDQCLGHTELAKAVHHIAVVAIRQRLMEERLRPNGTQRR